MAGKGRGGRALGIIGIVVALSAILLAILAGTGVVSPPGACITRASTTTGCGGSLPPAPSLMTTVSGSTLTVQNVGPAAADGFTAASILYSWGDGSISTSASPTASEAHTYTPGSDYTIHATEYWVFGATGPATFLTYASATVFIGSPGSMYDVTFGSGGTLPSGTAWGVTFNGFTQTSATNEIAFTAGYGDGTYSYSVAAPVGWIAVPSSGTVSISGASENVSIAFGVAANFYSVSFTESGLPSGTSWSVDLAGTILSSSASTILFQGEASGTYTFTILTLANVTASPSSGSITVSGASAAQPITFASTLSGYAVTFVESGLPDGASWTVTLGGAMQTSKGPSIVFMEPSGTYAFAISSSSGPSPSPPSGSLVVVGSSVTQAITFGAQAAPFWQWTPLAVWSLVAGIIIFLGACISFVEASSGLEIIALGIALPTVLYFLGWG